MEGRFEQAVAQLASPVEEERLQAIRTLYELQDRRAIDLLPRVVEMDRAVEVRYLARKTYYLLRDVIPEKQDEPFLPLPDGIALDDFEKLLFDENPRLRKEALALVPRIDAGSVAPFLRAALPKESDPALQAQVLAALGKVGTRHDIPAIAEFLKHADPALRMIAIDALATIGGAEALEYVVPVLRDADPKVRAQAGKVLQVLEPAEMLKILRTMATSTDLEMRDAAVFTLQRYRSAASAKILGYLAANDPDPGLRERAKTALEAMAKIDEHAKAVLDLLNKPEEPDDPNAPAIISLDGKVLKAMPEAPPASPGAPAPPPPKVMVVPGLSRKLARDISEGDAPTKEAALKQLAGNIGANLVPFLLLRLDLEEDVRIVSYLLTLLGKSKATSAYAAVIKRFKHPDDRVRANAIEAAMAIDPATTPDRVAGFLKDDNNRVRANSILACARRPAFDPLVFVQDLAAGSDPAWRRSALFVIGKLQRPSFLPVLADLVKDDDMEVRHLAFREIKNYAARHVRGAAELAEVAGKMLARETGGSGNFDEEFHKAMLAMRAPTTPKKVPRLAKAGKSATEELGEQLLGTDGLKEAGQKVKELQKQAQAARDKVKEKLAAMNWREKLVAWGGPAGLALFLVLHLVALASHLRAASPFRRLTLAATAAAFGLGALLSLGKRFGLAALLAAGLWVAPIVAAWLDVQDADLLGGPRVVTRPEPAAGETASAPVATPLPASAPPAVGASAPGPVPVAAPPAAPKAAATIRLQEPARGARLQGDLLIRAQVKGKARAVEIFLDEVLIKRFDEAREGLFEHRLAVGSEAAPGRRAVKVRVIDPAGRHAEDVVIVQLLEPLPDISILVPPDAGVYWRDEKFVAMVPGKSLDQVEFVLDGAALQTFSAEGEGRYEVPVALAALSEGPHTLEVRATLLDGRVATATSIFRALVPRPTIAFKTPRHGEEVFGTVPIEFAVDSGYRDTAVRSVTWYLDGVTKTTLASPPWQDSWDTRDQALGTHELRAVVVNELGLASEAMIRVDLIQPAFSVAIEGLKAGQVLTEDTTGTVTVVNEVPGTTIQRVVMTVDDRPFHELTASPFTFTIRVEDIPPGPRKLGAEVHRSDGQKARASLSFSVRPRHRRTIFLTARDAAGRFLTPADLGKAKLEVRQDGRSVGGFLLQSAGEAPMFFGLVLDLSASMKNDRRLNKAKEALAAFLDGMQPQDQAFLIAYSDAAETVAGFTSDRTRLQQELEYLPPKRGSALLEAVAQAVALAAGAPERTAVVIVADSGDENLERTARASRVPAAEVLEAVKQADVQIYTVGLGDLAPSAVADGAKELRGLAERSGGRFLAVPNPNDLPEALRGLMRELRSQIRLSFTMPLGSVDGKWHPLEITATGMTEIEMLYKPGYRAR
ncbi:MAG: conserved hypothetical membrane protein [Candidatus Ozemobacter sibiricus]|jgi:VWFA-related protein|uniref:Conserved hypothetical membrane protein n=1 Tax=Candidatus Ozemobacter sibiricus TaxID=2268124 RepID=A0A367ZQQ9_9BACT|nr:MAG: conserved hypothetical membrane protein [Candidatus Ozemobacter sibiricus]